MTYAYTAMTQFGKNKLVEHGCGVPVVNPTSLTNTPASFADVLNKAPRQSEASAKSTRT